MARVCTDLADRLEVERVDLYASGREALRVTLRAVAHRSGREEAIVPAYTCYSVPSAVVAAGLRVRLVDVDARGWIDPRSFARLPLERAAAVVICNLFGLPEAVAPLRELARGSGVAIVDDAAQALGARGSDGPVGGRGDVGVLSFGRGKPLAALGGGALAWANGASELGSPPAGRRRRTKALLRAAAHDAALMPSVFRVLAAIPALHVGESRFDPHFAEGGIAGDALFLAAAALAGLDDAARRRVDRAEFLARRIRAETPFVPLLAPTGSHGVYPRLALLAPSRAAREGVMPALEALGSGASRMYPASLDAVEPLRIHLVEPCPCLGAREIAARIVTLPTHGRGGRRRVEETIQALAGSGS